MKITKGNPKPANKPKQKKIKTKREEFRKAVHAFEKAFRDFTLKCVEITPSINTAALMVSDTIAHEMANFFDAIHETAKAVKEEGGAK